MSKFIKDQIPKYTDLMNPTLKAIRDLGGSASINEIENTVIENMNLSEEVVEFTTTNESITTLKYNLSWARHYLKKSGLINNSKRGIWSITSRGSENDFIDPEEIAKTVKIKDAKARKQKKHDGNFENFTNLTNEQDSWERKLLDILKKISPEAFERLCQRLLRESGFIEVEVTGKSGDGGIDGKGIIRLAGLISFQVMFQCKRYKESVSANIVRDFRSAMQGRADKGLIITTGTFTKSAQQEATRDGVPPIDLIDGELLAERLRDSKLGVSTHIVEEIEIDSRFFDSI